MAAPPEQEMVKLLSKLKTKLDSNLDNEKKILKIFQELSVLPLTVGLLQETGIGKSVNSYRKYTALDPQGYSPVGDASKALVKKWKTLVAECEEHNPVKSHKSGPSPQIIRNHHEDICRSTGSSSLSSLVEIKNSTNKAKKAKLGNPSLDGEKHGKTHKRHHTKQRESPPELFSNSHIIPKSSSSHSSQTKDEGIKLKKRKKSFKESVSKSGNKSTKQRPKHTTGKNEESVSKDKVKLNNKVKPGSVDLTAKGPSQLPIINPDYRPLRMPLLLREDGSSGSNSAKKRKVATMEEEDLNFTSKQNRTKVFSGKSRSSPSEVPSLYDSSLKVLMDNIDLMYEVGVPYDIIHPVLEKSTPDQLLRLEDYNPYFLEDTDPLWEVHCTRDFKGHEPGEMESWRELYLRLCDERQARLKKITAHISASQAKKDPVRQVRLAYVDIPVKPPRDVMRRQLKNGTSPFDSPPGKAGARFPAPRAREGVAGRAAGGRPPPAARPADKVVKVVAPMMRKSMKMFQNRWKR